MDKKKLYAHLALLGTTIIFGFNGPISKILVAPGGISPFVHMFCRFSGATLLFWLVSLFLPHESIRRKDILPLVGVSITGVLFNQGIFAIAISMTSPMNQSLITTLGPVITMLLAAFILREPITWLKALGVVLGASGVLLLIFSGQQAKGAFGWGEIVSLIATTSYCLYLTLFKEIILRYSPVTLMKWLFTISLCLVSPISVPKMMETPWGSFSTMFYLQLAFVILGATFVAYFLLPIAQKTLRPTVVSIYNYGIPVVATTAALAWGMERFTFAKGLAALLVLLGVYAVTRSKSRKAVLQEEKRQRG